MDKQRPQHGESACHVDEQALQAGKPLPKKGKTATVLRELIAAEGAPVDDRHLMRVSGTDYIVNTVASIQAMGWVITNSTRFVRDRLGRRVRRRSYALDHANNGIVTKKITEQHSNE